MKIVLKKQALLQYLLIYIMFLIPGSCLFQVYLGNEKYFIILGFFVLLFLTQKKYRINYGILFTLILAILFFVVRIIVGGIGIQVWAQFAVCVLSAQFAISCDPKNFLTRWTKLVVFFALVSVLFWFFFTISPQVADSWPAEEYFVQTIGIDQWANDYYGKGLLFYSYLDVHPDRNCGIFTEPGVYQTVLNSTLFILLFWRDKVVLKNKKQYLNYIVIICVTLVTCASTTGFVGMLIILFGYLFFYRRLDYLKGKVKKLLVLFLFVMLVILGIDYSIRGEDSLFYLQVIQKLFPSGDLNLTQGSGQYRLGMIYYSLSLIINNPFGVGYDVFNNGLESGLVAASLVSFAAVFGIISWIIVIVFVFYPVFKYERMSIAILFLCMFINTTLAQTDLLYPAQIMIPLYLITIRKIKLRTFNGEGDRFYEQ